MTPGHSQVSAYGARALARRAFVVGLVLGAVCGCSSPEPPTPVDATPALASGTAGIAVANAPRAPAATLRGVFEARDGGLFTVCGETARRTIRRVDPISDRVLREATAKTPSRFVAARGRIVGRDQVEIDAFELVGGDGWNCESRFDDFYFAARGTAEPWTLDVTSAAVTFADAPGAPPAVYAYRAFVLDQRELSFTDLQDAVPFRVSLRESPCVDGMTDTVYALQATIDAGGHAFAGCAWRGEPEP